MEGRRRSAENVATGEHDAERDLKRNPMAYLRDELSIPKWLARKWIDLYGAEEAAKLAQSINEIPLHIPPFSESA